MKLDDAELKQIMVKAIFDHLTPEKREQLIKDGIESILSSKRPNSYDGKTVFEEAFINAVHVVAREVAIEELKKPEMHAKLRELIVGGVEKAIDPADAEQYGALQDKIANAVIQGITKERY